MADKDHNKAAPPPARSDAFWLTDLYPDAAALFRHEQASLGEISDTCIVVLDANVLLWPFELGAASVEDIAKVYKELAHQKRLVVPGQAAREFYKHRSRKVAALTEAIDGIIERTRRPPLDKAMPLLSNDADFLAARKLNSDIVNAGKELARHLAAVSQRLKDEIGTDRVSSIYRGVLADCVVEIPDGNKERNSIIDEAERRARLQIAPGYKDQNKDDGGLGDLIIWMTILQEGAGRKAHCIFVTNEEKSDWWIRTRGAFQPRPELIEEYRRKSDGHSIHFLPLSALLANFKATQQTVDEVQKLEDERRDHDTAQESAAVQSRMKLRKAYVDRLVERQEQKTRLKVVEASIASLRDRIENEDPAAVAISDWDLLNSLAREQHFLRQKLQSDELNAGATWAEFSRFFEAHTSEKADSD